MARSGEGESFAVLGPPGVRPVVNSIFDFSAAALAELRLWLEQNPPAVPITSILGFAQFLVVPAPDVSAYESTTSTTYTDLATVGPKLTGLPDGKYMLLFGSVVKSDTAAAGVAMSLELNGATATDTDFLASEITSNVTLMRAVFKTLANGGSNTVIAKYRGGLAPTVTGSFGSRWLAALKYANK